MIIKIDNREQRLLYEINNREIPKDCTVICKKLELGDVVIFDIVAVIVINAIMMLLTFSRWPSSTWLPSRTSN